MLRAKCTGVSGATPWQRVANENAWASITIAPNGNLAGATVKFQISHTPPAEQEPFRYGLKPNPVRADAAPIDFAYQNINDATGAALTGDIDAVGFYDFATRIGGVYGRIVWSGGDADDTSFDIAVNTQMV